MVLRSTSGPGSRWIKVLLHPPWIRYWRAAEQLLTVNRGIWEWLLLISCGLIIAIIASKPCLSGIKGKCSEAHTRTDVYSRTHSRFQHNPKVCQHRKQARGPLYWAWLRTQKSCPNFQTFPDWAILDHQTTRGFLKRSPIKLVTTPNVTLPT